MGNNIYQESADDEEENNFVPAGGKMYRDFLITVFTVEDQR
jgi:hypothetical protein